MVNGYELNVIVFKDTRKKSQTLFKEATNDAIKKSTVIKHPEKIRIGKRKKQAMEIEFFDGGTIQATVKNHDNTAILNFADALVAGGLVDIGEFTQEENICRCTNLYETLIKKSNQKDYYEYNTQFGSIYSDRIIWSRDITVFKDDTEYNMIKPYKVDVITCPAPSSRSATAYVIFNRIVGIIKASAKMKKDTLVLGMWGCGAFGQNPVTVGTAFAQALKQYPYFKKIIFAIRPTYGDVKAVDPMADLFKRAFWLEYKGSED